MWCFCLCAAGEIAWFWHRLRGRPGHSSGAGAPRAGGASAVEEGLLGRDAGGGAQGLVQQSHRATNRRAQAAAAGSVQRAAGYQREATAGAGTSRAAARRRQPV